LALGYLEKAIEALSKDSNLTSEQNDRLDCYKLDYVELAFELDLLNDENLKKSMTYLMKLNKKSQRNSVKVEFFLNECRRLLLLNKSKSENKSSQEAIQLRFFEETRISLYRSNRNQLHSLVDIVQAMWDYVHTYYQPERKYAESIEILTETLIEINRTGYAKPHLNKHVVTSELIFNLFQTGEFRDIFVLAKENAESVSHFANNLPVYADTIYYIYASYLNTNQKFNFKDLEKISEYVNAGLRDNIHFLLGYFYYRSGQFGDCVQKITQIATKREEHEVYLVAATFWNMCEDNFQRVNSRDIEFIQNNSCGDGNNEIIQVYKYLIECLLNGPNIVDNKQIKSPDEEQSLLRSRILIQHLDKQGIS
jgi:hypothetical protein